MKEQNQNNYIIYLKDFLTSNKLNFKIILIVLRNSFVILVFFTY